MEPTGAIARWFPLVARPRPVCTALDARVGELCTLANAAERDANPVTASAVHNQAALLASDCGLPDLARSWCHRHAQAYLRACPLSGQAARHALEPLVNLARLHIRDGHGETALQLLNSLFRAVSSRIDSAIDGLPVPTATLTASPDAHQEVRRWLWTALLADGARALTSSGRWSEALAHLQRHKGVGRRMLDGRQVAVIASVTTGDLGTALELLETTIPGERWENAVTACLTALCREGTDSNGTRSADIAGMLESYEELDAPAPGLAVFHTRLALSVVDTAGGVAHPDAHAVATSLIHHTLARCDGYAIRDLLAHTGCARLLTDDQRHHLVGIVDACALGRGTIPISLRADLTTALRSAEQVITRAVAGDRRGTAPHTRSPEQGRFCW